MDWKECVRGVEELGAYTRFDWPLSRGRIGFDCNMDAFTISDVTGGAAWVWTWPGDYLLNTKAVGSFFELGPETVVGSWWSYAFPVLLWLIPIVLVVVLEERRAFLRHYRR